MSERILIFIPAYNCEQQITRVVDGLSGLKDNRLEFGVLVVENRSSDRTLEFAESALERCSLLDKMLVQNKENYNLGGSHKVAFEIARNRKYDYIIVLHGDDQCSIADIIPHLNFGHHRSVEALLGARFMKGSALEGYSKLRTWANIVFNNLFSVVSGKRLYDLGSGINLYRMSIFDDLFYARFADDLTFNYFLILALAQKRVRIEFFPITWREEDQVSNAKLTSQGLRMIKMLGRYIFSSKAFLEAEHREGPRAVYPTAIIRQWSCSAERL